MVLIDASGLGEKIKDGKNQKTILFRAEEQKTCDIFTHVREDIAGFLLFCAEKDGFLVFAVFNFFAQARCVD